MPLVFKGTSFWPIAFIVHLSLQILGALFIIAGETLQCISVLYLFALKLDIRKSAGQRRALV